MERRQGVYKSICDEMQGDVQRMVQQEVRQTLATSECQEQVKRHAHTAVEQFATRDLRKSELQTLYAISYMKRDLKQDYETKLHIISISNLHK